MRIPTLKIVVLLALLICGCNSLNCSGPGRIVRKEQGSVYEGKITGKPFVNKVGKENPKIVDLYFETNGESYFIKFIESGVKRDEILRYVDKGLQIRGIQGEGLWDSDDPNVQSRVGKYVVIYEIVK